MSNFIRIADYLRRHYVFALLNILFNLLSSVFSLVSIAMIIPFLNLLFKDSQTQGSALTPPTFRISVEYFIDLFNYHFLHIIQQEGKLQALIALCIVVIVVFFFKNLFRYLALFFLAPLRTRAVAEIREKLYKKLLSLPLSYFSDQKKGDLMARLTSDVQEIETGIISTIEVLFKEPITILIFLGAMLYMSPEFTAFVLIMILITALVIGRIGKSLKRASLRAQNRLGEMLAVIEETLSGMRVVKAFRAEDYQFAKFKMVNTAYTKIMNATLRRRDLSSPLSEFLGIVIVVAVLWFGGRLVLNPAYPLGAETFIGFMVIFSQLIPPAKSFSSAYYNIQKALASVDRINKILEADIRIREKPNARPIDSFRDKIEFRGVSFAYYNYDDKWVLRDVHLTIHKGKVVALVGPSGAGKTTLVDLLPRFYDPVEGQILIDGIDIRDYRLSDLRRLMGVVTQEAVLFNDTVFNNIRFGVENASLESVIQAAKIANAHEFIMRLENGYDTLIGDRGCKLSGGERQRLTIARAVLSNPDILILDEATSSLDTENEKLVQEAIYKLMANRTSIVIAHRLSTIQFADEIIVMQDGKIQERGNHASLTARNGLYKRLVDLQAF
ncbi:MAG: ABC transporter ATP-binding protein [Chitinophagales bacterium]|nr:MAG: ABC transporter ATP-binding protein [Chitinophagales bacterium]